MSTMLILPPETISAVTGDGASPENLLTPDPREVWVAPSAATVYINALFPGPATVDTVFLGYAYLGQASAVRVTVDGTQVASGAFTLPRFSGSRPAHALVQFARPATSSHFQIAIDVAAGDRPLALGTLMMGTAFRPTWNIELGSGRTPIDTGSRTALAGGGFAIDPGVIKSAWQWTLGDLSDDELAYLYAVVCNFGETQPLLVVEDPSTAPGLGERIHYGLLTKLAAYERRDVGLSRWGLQIEDWL